MFAYAYVRRDMCLVSHEPCACTVLGVAARGAVVENLLELSGGRFGG
jgi:hypothetical protein